MRLKTLLAAAAMSIGLLAHAEYADKAMSFEGMTVDSPATVATELAAQDSATWDLQGNTDVAAKAYGAEASYEPRPSQFAIDTQDKYLSIKTPLTNGVIRAAGDATIDGAIYVDTLVKFTAADDDLDIPTDGKIAVWVKAMDEDGTENHIMVTAGPIVDQKPTTYDCGEISNLDAWHRLTIKVIGDVTNGDSQNGLVVYLDAKSDSADILFSDDAKAAFAGYTLSDVAAEYKRNGQLFPAMQSSATLASVEFAGQGSVDDIVYTETQPAFAADPMIYTVAWEAGVTAFDYTPYGGEKVSKTGLEGAGEDKFVWDGVNAPEVDETSIVPAEGKMASVDVGTGITTIKVSDLAATAIIDGEPATFSDIDAAVAAINNANASATLTLGANVDHDLTFTADIDLVIDLAGKTILADTANAICVEAGTVLVTNTTAEVGTVSANGVTDAYAFYYSGSAYATLAAGIFEGPVSADGYTICQGGQFSKEGNTEGGECVLTAAEGLEFTDTEVDGYWTLTEVQSGPFDGGSGTEADPYQIGSVAALIELKTEVAAGNYLTAFFVQTADINFAEVSVTGGWDGIGTSANNFAGTFDGGKYKFTGALALARKSYGGLFGDCNGATIKNVTFDSTVVLAPPAGSGSAGYAVIGRTGSNTKLINITMSGKIGTEANPCNHNVAGIAVSSGADVLFENCVMDGELWTTGPTNDHVKAGGMVSICSTGAAGTYTTFKGCTVAGSIHNKTVYDQSKPDDLATAGALCGYSNSGIKVIDNCDVSGATFDVTAADELASVDCGMFFGYCSDVFEVTNTIAKADIVAVGSHVNANNAKQLWLATINGDGKAVYDAANATPDLTGATTYKVMLPCAAFALNRGESITLDETVAAATVTAVDTANDEIKHTGNLYECVEKSTFPLDPDEELTPAGEAAKAAVIEAFGDGLTTWANAVYADGKIPASKLNATTDELIAASKEFNLPIMTAGVEITVAAAEDGFTFTIVDDGTPVNVQAAYLQKLIKYTDDLTDDFGASTDKVTITPNKDGTAFDAKFNTPEAAAGFMKADMTVEK